MRNSHDSVHVLGGRHVYACALETGLWCAVVGRKHLDPILEVAYLGNVLPWSF